MMEQTFKPLILRCSVCERMATWLAECDRCGKYACEGCLAERYENFSYYDGNVDIVQRCAICEGWEPEIGVYR